VLTRGRFLPSSGLEWFLYEGAAGSFLRFAHLHCQTRSLLRIPLPVVVAISCCERSVPGAIRERRVRLEQAQ